MASVTGVFAEEGDVSGVLTKEAVDVWTAGLESGLNVPRRIMDCCGRWYYWDVRRLSLADDISVEGLKADGGGRIALTINVNFSDNTNGPAAHFHRVKSTGKAYGYKTEAEALSCTAQSDFVSSGGPAKMKAFYSFDGNALVLKGGNELFKMNVLKHEKQIGPFLDKVRSFERKGVRD